MRIKNPLKGAHEINIWRFRVVWWSWNKEIRFQFYSKVMHEMVISWNGRGYKHLFFN